MTVGVLGIRLWGYLRRPLGGGAQGLQPGLGVRHLTLEKGADGAVVLPSPRGRAKVLFLVKDQARLGPDRHDRGPRWWALRALVGRDLADYLDRSPTANSRIYFTAAMLYRWRETKSRLRPAGSLRSLARRAGWRARPSGSRRQDPVANVPRYPKALPPDIKALAKTKAAQRVIRAILGAPVMDGGLRLVSHERIGAACRVTANAVRRNANKLIDGGYLRRIRHGRVEHGKRQASLYAFTEKLFALLPALAECPKTVAPAAPLPRPETVRIPDGEWHAHLFDLAYAFPVGGPPSSKSGDELFLDYVRRIPGAAKGDREKQARGIWRFRLKGLTAATAPRRTTASRSLVRPSRRKGRLAEGLV